MRRLVLLPALGLLVLALLLIPASASAAPKPGSQSLGDPLFPQIGNGGYDVFTYDLDVDYDPTQNRLLPGTGARITAKSTQDLSRFSLDFQKDLEITAVTVDGQPAEYKRKDAKPQLSKNPRVTQPAKLIITPAAPIANDKEFVVDVRYDGVPQAFVDTDLSLEGWVRSCSTPDNCDGSFTVSEPIGAQSWFPSNNYQQDKATFITRITVPDGYTALGAGVLTSRVPAGTGTRWTWEQDQPMATYLSTATVGKYDFIQTTMQERNGTMLPVDGAISTGGKKQGVVARNVKQLPSMINFLAKRFGPYPFSSTGYVAGFVPSVGYALENQTKPHFAGTEKGPQINQPELLHELAHQWMGDSVTGDTWQQVWFNEGWATFAEVYWGHASGHSDQSPRQFFKAVLDIDPKAFRRPPADLGTPRHLFDGVAVYNRPGAMIEGYREIVGNKRFFAFAKHIQRSHRYDTITEQEFVDAAKRGSGLSKSGKRHLGGYFRQWLHRRGVPRITPADFR